MNAGFLCAVCALALIAPGASAKKATPEADAMQALAKVVRESGKDSQGRSQYVPKTPPVDSWTPGEVKLRVWSTLDGAPCAETNDKARAKKCMMDYAPVCNLFPNANLLPANESWAEQINAVKFKESSFKGMVPILSALIGANGGSNNTVAYSATIGNISTHEVSLFKPYEKTREQCVTEKDETCLANYQSAGASFDYCKNKIEKLKTKLPVDQWDNIFLVRKIVVADDFVVDFDRNPQMKINPQDSARSDNVIAPPAIFTSDGFSLEKIAEGVSDYFRARGLFDSAAVIASETAGAEASSPTPAAAPDATPADDATPDAATEPGIAAAAGAKTANRRNNDKLQCGSGFAAGVGHAIGFLRYARQACLVSDSTLQIRDPRVIGYVPASMTALETTTALEHRPGAATIVAEDIEAAAFESAEAPILTSEIKAILEQ